MPKKKVLGAGVDGRDVVNFNVRLIVKYETTYNEKIKREAVIPIQTTDKQTATALAIEKAKQQLELFPYIKKSTVIIEPKGRNKKEV